MKSFTLANNFNHMVLRQSLVLIIIVLAIAAGSSCVRFDTLHLKSNVHWPTTSRIMQWTAPICGLQARFDAGGHAGLYIEERVKSLLKERARIRVIGPSISTFNNTER